MDSQVITELLLVAPILLFSMVAHEYAHGWVAYKNGDPTAYNLGRLTWNPAKHIDPFMTLILPVILALSHMPILGGAKPVPVEPRRFRHFKTGDIQVSLAGITANILIAFACTAFIVPLYYVGKLVGQPAAVSVLQHMLAYGVSINLVLAGFNLLPLPPLDGSHVMKYLLPPAWSLGYQRMGRYGFILVYALILLVPQLLRLWLFPAFWLSDTLVGSVTRYVIPWPFAP